MCIYTCMQIDRSNNCQCHMIDAWSSLAARFSDGMPRAAKGRGSDASDDQTGWFRSARRPFSQEDPGMKHEWPLTPLFHYSLWRWGVTCLSKDVLHETPDVAPCRTSPPMSFFRTRLARNTRCNTMSRLTAAMSSMLFETWPMFAKWRPHSGRARQSSCGWTNSVTVLSIEELR